MAIEDFAYPGLIVFAPVGPKTYLLPSGTTVTNGTGLETQLAGSPTNDTIILADGTYNPTSNYFTNNNGYSIYAENLGGATLTGGVWVDSPGDLTIQGLDIALTTTANEAAGSGCIQIGTAATGVSVLDCTLDGAATADRGITCREPDGFVARRIVATNFTDDGVLVQRVNGPNLKNAVQTPVIVSDVEARNCRRATPGSGSGTTEFGLWAGHTGDYQRIFASGCGWGGIWAGNACYGSYFSDIVTFSNFAKTGIYFERFSHGCYMRRFVVDGDCQQGVVVEYGASGVERATSIGTLVEYGYIFSKKKGLERDVFSRGFTMRNTRFAGQKHFALNNWQGNFSVDPWDTTNNNYDDIGVGAVDTTTAHTNTFNG